MNITKISDVRFSQQGSTCTFAVDYSAVYSQAEVNAHFQFSDAIRVMEHDPSDDDVVKNWFAGSAWTPTTKEDRWTWTVRVNEDDVDTEIGGEEIFMQIALHNRTTSSPFIFGQTRIIQVSPG